MSVQVAVRMEEEDLHLLDQEVKEGQAKNRSDAIRKLIDKRRRELLYAEESRVMASILARGEQVHPDAEPFVTAQDWQSWAQ